MSDTDEQARAAAYRLSQKRQAAYRRTRLLALRGSVAARKRLAADWAPWRPLDGPESPPPTDPPA